jgi:hypothetical protein
MMSHGVGHPPRLLSARPSDIRRLRFPVYEQLIAVPSRQDMYVEMQRAFLLRCSMISLSCRQIGGRPFPPELAPLDAVSRLIGGAFSFGFLSQAFARISVACMQPRRHLAAAKEQRTVDRVLHQSWPDGSALSMRGAVMSSTAILAETSSCSSSATNYPG